MGIVQGTFGQPTYGSTELRPTDIGCNRYTKQCISDDTFLRSTAIHRSELNYYENNILLSISLNSLSIVRWTVCLLNSMSVELYARWTLCPLNIMPVEHYAHWTACLWNSMSVGHYVRGTVCPLNIVSIELKNLDLLTPPLVSKMYKILFFILSNLNTFSNIYIYIFFFFICDETIF